MKKKKLLLPIFLFFSNFFLFSNQNVGLSIKPYTAINYGQYDELLYDYYDSYLVSGLYWEQNGIITIGLESSLQIHNFLFSLETDFGIPEIYGKMEDFDWNYDELVIYSIHENKTTNKMNLGFSTIYKMKITPFLTLSPQISFYYASNSFEARNGKRWDAESNLVKKAGKIDYKHVNYYTFFGFNFEFLYKDLSISFATLISPYTYTYAYDNHITMDFYTEQYVYSYFTRYCVKLDVNKLFYKNFIAGFSVQGFFGKNDKGLLYWNGEVQSHKPIAGNREYSIKSSLYCTYIF